jgi:hypothetical protein
MATPVLVETYARQLKAVIEAGKPGWENQVTKLADLMLAACQTLRDGIVGVAFNRDNKFDLQLSQALIDEQRLAEILSGGKIELKSESFQWEQTGNICIEYEQNGQPSGIAVTEADVWIHELKRDGETLVYLMFPIARLKELAREAFKAGRFRTGAGDGGRFSVIIIPLADILR